MLFNGRLRNTGLCFTIGCVQALAWAGDALAHRDTEEQIAEISARIVSRTGEAELYLIRAALLRREEDWAAALNDCDRAAELEPADPDCDLCRAAVEFERGRLAAADSALDRFERAVPDAPQGWLLRSRVQQAEGDLWSAARSLGQAIDLMESPSPDLYLEQVDCLRTAPGDHRRMALAVLEDARSRIGPVVSLDFAAAEIEGDLELFDAAYERLEALAVSFGRKETLWVRQARILRRAGRGEEACRLYRMARAAIEDLEPRHRNKPATIELETEIKRALEECE